MYETQLMDEYFAGVSGTLSVFLNRFTLNNYITLLEAFVIQLTIKWFVTQDIAFDLLNSMTQMMFVIVLLKGSLKQFGNTSALNYNLCM